MMDKTDSSKILMVNDRSHSILNSYCVWFGPELDPMPEFVAAQSPDQAEFIAVMRRFKRGHTLYLIKTTMMPPNPTEDNNPLDRFCGLHSFVPRDRLFRVWMSGTFLANGGAGDILPTENWVSLVVMTDDPEDALAMAVDWMITNNMMHLRVFKVTELPYDFSQEYADDCGDVELRRRSSKRDRSGEFSIVDFAKKYELALPEKQIHVKSGNKRRKK